MTDSDIYIFDDGTLDTIVSFQDTLYRFNSEYRFSFDSDKAFLKEVKEDLEKYGSLYPVHYKIKKRREIINKKLKKQIDWWENN